MTPEEPKQFTPEALTEMIDHLCTGSDRMLDDCVKPRLQALKGRPLEDVKDELLGIIDDCVYAALTSDFVVQVLHILWLNCGGSEQELQERNALLRDDSKIEELRPRFKWQTR